MTEKSDSLRQQCQIPLETEEPLATSWRPVHYLGSKFRLLPEIQRLIDTIDPTGGTVADIFSGSGSVSLALSHSRKVVACDIQEYSRVLCSALLAPPTLTPSESNDFLARCNDRVLTLTKIAAPLIELESIATNTIDNDLITFCDMVEYGGQADAPGKPKTISRFFDRFRKNIKCSPTRLLATRYFGGSYFAYHQTIAIDAILETIQTVGVPYKDIFRAPLLSAASDLVNSIGKQFAQPFRLYDKSGLPKRELIRTTIRNRRVSAMPVYSNWLNRYSSRAGNHKGISIIGDYREIIPRLENISIAYADPPYTRDHYSRFYHVLETLCLEDFPRVSSTSIKGRGFTRGAYRTERHQSPFSIKTQAPDAFRQLFSLVAEKQIPLVVSYSPTVANGHPRLMTIDGITDIAKRYFSVNIEQARSPFVHSKLNRSDTHLASSKNSEVFIVCRP